MRAGAPRQLSATHGTKVKTDRRVGEPADRAPALADASEHTCQTCGGPGRIRLRGNGPSTWIQSSCQTFRTPYIRQAAPAASRESVRSGAFRP